MTGSVRIRPGGPAGVVAAVAVAILAAVAVIGTVFLAVTAVSDPSMGLLTLIGVVPSLLFIAICLRLVVKVASGFTIEATGITRAARHPAPLTWAEVGGLRWGRTRWWGRHNHQLMADLRDGNTVIVWGVRNAAQHRRIIAGLTAATQEGLVPPTVARTPDLNQDWPAVAASLAHARTRA